MNRRIFIATAECITRWKWMNRECYQLILGWEEVAQQHGFPLADFEILLRSESYTSPGEIRDFIQDWFEALDDTYETSPAGAD